MFIRVIGVACMLYVVDPSNVSQRVIHFWKVLLWLHYADAKLNMTQLLLLGKFEYTGGPIFKVVLEC